MQCGNRRKPAGVAEVTGFPVCPAGSDRLRLLVTGLVRRLLREAVGVHTAETAIRMVLVCTENPGVQSVADANGCPVTSTGI